MKRKIIEIDENLCTGCGLCIPNCPEGAIRIIDNKARLLSDLFCDGLGACIGHCPEGAISVTEREAQPYDETRVMANIVRQGTNTIRAHLEHLLSHNETGLYDQAVAYLKNADIDVPDHEGSKKKIHAHTGCPGARMMEFGKDKNSNPAAENESGTRISHLRHWPVQLHLLSPVAPYLDNADLLLSADCVAYTLGDFHRDFLKDRSLAIACPKLDDGLDVYLEKIIAMIDEGNIRSITVMTMEVPCCSGLLHIAKQAAERAERKISLNHIQVSIQGRILAETRI